MCSSPGTQPREYPANPCSVHAPRSPSQGHQGDELIPQPPAAQGSVSQVGAALEGIWGCIPMAEHGKKGWQLIPACPDSVLGDPQGPPALLLSPLGLKV